ncbi:MAG: hypothetical protein M1348_00735 [Candidatus Parvarchaeota archaeon]|nr:hypothetical protein [Candidatus Parvarchaeota archaeon]MCL5101123.1 hypothetical protein [Candidatus Parvarchaeota archaeon]
MVLYRKGQFTTEYLIVIGIALSVISIFMIYVFFYYAGYSSTVNSNLAASAAASLVENANYVASIGLGSKITFPVNFPSVSFPESYFCGNYIKLVSGQYSSIQKSRLNLQGVLPITPGVYMVYVRYNSSGTVQMGLEGVVSYINASYSLNVNTLSYSLRFYNSSYKLDGATPFNISVFSSSGNIINSTSGTTSAGSVSGSLLLNGIYSSLIIDVLAKTGNVIAASCLIS